VIPPCRPIIAQFQAGLIISLTPRLAERTLVIGRNALVHRSRFEGQVGIA
jgi:hypothetical protein